MSAGSARFGSHVSHRAADPLEGSGALHGGTLLLGISGARQNAAVAAVTDGRLAGGFL